MIQERLSGVAGLWWHWTAASREQEPVFRSILDNLPAPPRRIVEIGTFHGVSTALLAEYAPVTTVDIVPSRIRGEVWRALGVVDRITERVCVSSRERDRTISAAIQAADLAFVDGCHLMPDVMRDFTLAIPCGQVIMHDYWNSSESWPDVREFVDGLNPSTYQVTRTVPFAFVKRGAR